MKDYKERADAADALVEYLEATRGREFLVGYLIAELMHNHDEIHLHNLLEDYMHRDKVNERMAAANERFA